MNYIPNIISGLRILLIPFFAYFIINSHYSYALYFFITMCISDALDGYIARFLRCESISGAYLDAIADKLMINVSFFILYIMDILPFYIFVIVVLRDFIIFYGIILNNSFDDSVRINPIFISKVNTVMQMVLVLYCLLFLNNIISLNYIQDIINTVILTTVLSAMEYIYNYINLSRFKNSNRSIRYSSNL